MTELALQIARYLDDEPPPGIVAAEFVDANGRRHTLIDKVPIFSSEFLDGCSSYPRLGSAACKVLARWQDALGRTVAHITTERPFGIESTEGLSEFVVLGTQLTDEH